VNEDGWTCGITDDGMYRVNALRYIIDSPQQTPTTEIIKWTHDVPLKVLCFVWRANLGRIPTVTELIKRGITVTSLNCTHCSTEEEDTIHALWSCTFAKTVWEWILRWCDLPTPDIDSIGDLLSFMNERRNGSVKRRDLIPICYGTLWSIWKARCDWIFKQIRASPTKVADNVKSLVYTWVKHRRHDCHYNWMEWCVSPSICS